MSSAIVNSSTPTNDILSVTSMRKINALDAGLNIFSAKSVKATESLVDLQQIMQLDNSKELIQAVEPLELFKALKKRGYEDSLEILPLVSTEQMTTLFDLEAWSEDGELLLESSLSFLSILKSVSNTFLAQTFKNLDEEYQLGLLDGQVETVEREFYDKMNDVEQDQLTPFPGEELFYKVKSDDPEVEEILDGLVEGLLGLDVAYAVSLLSHATYVPPLEQKSLAAQFRNSRLGEYGFVPYEDSLQVWNPSELNLRFPNVGFPKTSATIVTKTSQTFFLELVFEYIEKHSDLIKVQDLRRNLLYFSNMLASACRVAPENLHGLQAILDRARSMINFSLEKVSGGDLALAAEILLSTSPKEIFQNTIREVDVLRRQIVQHIAKHYIEHALKIENLLYYRRHGEMLNYIDCQLLSIYGFETCEVLKALFNRFPSVLVEKNPNDRQRYIFRTLSSAEDFSILQEFVTYFIAET